MANSTISDGLQGMELNGGIEQSPFPAATKQVAGLVNGVETDLTSMYFSDKILITIVQGGRLAQWVCAFHHGYLKY
jgi:proteasome assembly chaperone 3